MGSHRSIWRAVLEEKLESRDDKIGIGKVEEMEIEKWAENYKYGTRDHRDDDGEEWTEEKSVLGENRW